MHLVINKFGSTIYVRKDIPLKEGLRLVFKVSVLTPKAVRKDIPLKEGLRPVITRYGVRLFNDGPKGYSTKRRIKTHN